MFILYFYFIETIYTIGFISWNWVQSHIDKVMSGPLDQTPGLIANQIFNQMLLFFPILQFMWHQRHQSMKLHLVSFFLLLSAAVNFSNVSSMRGWIRALVTFLWLFSSVYLQIWPGQEMYSHVNCVCHLFSTVGFQMSSQIACLWGCKVTLAAFVWPFSTVGFQMCLQIAYTRGCVITLVAFVKLFSTVCFQMSPQMTCPRGCIITLIAFV